MKKYLVIVLILIGLCGHQAQAALLTIAANGVDRDGLWAQSLIDIDKIDEDGIFLLTIKGDGGPSIKTDGSVYITTTYFGSTSNGYGIRDSAQGFGIWNAPFFYIFTSITTDFDLIGAGSGYTAHFIVLKMDYNTSTLVLDKLYDTIYLSKYNVLCNTWFVSIPLTRFEYSIY